MNPTKEQLGAAFQILVAVADSIKIAGKIPSGQLYAAMMAHVSLSAFNSCIATLERAGVIRRDSDFQLVWIGPKS